MEGKSLKTDRVERMECLFVALGWSVGDSAFHVFSLRRALESEDLAFSSQSKAEASENFCMKVIGGFRERRKSRKSMRPMKRTDAWR